MPRENQRAILHEQPMDLRTSLRSYHVGSGTETDLIYADKMPEQSIVLRSLRGASFHVPGELSFMSLRCTCPEMAAEVASALNETPAWILNMPLLHPALRLVLEEKVKRLQNNP